jgi:hypothetical protein
MPCNNIFELAEQIWSEIGSPASITVDAIAARLGSSYYIGKLMNLTDECFTFDSNKNVIPELGSEILGIFSEMYKSDYYNQKIMELFGAGGLDWVTMKEGDTTITRVNSTEKAKVFKDMKKQADYNVRFLVASYLNNGVKPTSSDFHNVAPGSN